MTTGRTFIPQPNERSALVLGVCAICMACLAAFYPALGGGYVFDDHAFVENNALLNGPLWRIWFSTDAVDYWPLTYSSFWLELRLWGYEPFAHHLVNIALHATTAVLLWRVLKLLEIPGAWLAGLLFAIHPVTVESVAWIFERKNVLSGAFYSASILWWLRYRASSLRTAYLAAMGLFLLTLLAKTSSVALPLVLIGIDLWREGRLCRRSILDVAPFLALSFFFGLLTYWFQTTLAMSGGWSGVEWWERIGRSAWAWLTYLRHAFVPVGLAFIYPPWPEVVRPVFWAPLAASVVLAVVFIWKGRSGLLRPVTFALGYHLLLVGPVIGLVEISYFAYGPVSNHLQYLAIMGPTALTAAALATAARRWPKTSTAAVCLITVGFAYTTASRSTAFRDDLSLWSAAVHDAPQSFNAAWTHALRLGEANRPREARRVVEGVLSRIQDPASRLRATAFINLIDGHPDNTVAMAAQAQSLRYDIVFQLDLAFFLANEGYPEQAVQLLQPELARQPRNVVLRYRLGSALAKAGRIEESIVVMREACRLSPRPGDSCTALVVLLARAGRPQEARRELATAMGVRLDDPMIDGILKESRIPQTR